MPMSLGNLPRDDAILLAVSSRFMEAELALCALVQIKKALVH
uniref:Uncharacterized protein n=1 Tax=Anguilla anguilla TaxID=7936 RepID=A0A0E9WC80_ANGAN